MIDKFTHFSAIAPAHYTEAQCSIVFKTGTIFGFGSICIIISKSLLIRVIYVIL